ncbi:tetratricopeptide repeat-containing sensor histidine kinase [Dyadobacter psychrotolerans]|uniref:histidine kinase n=1 Tax=Dyadobacter psychrotolerans TaxID=2541721 RepID=A0A4R5DBL9_9BACT|nr:tetratricopeptide repeat-containing sensor histidine kinase [Dyadobacter psychrotolerans]TDE11086.1 sensor histidine kinase [Dyadobacter psychrotolerans]
MPKFNNQSFIGYLKFSCVWICVLTLSVCSCQTGSPKSGDHTEYAIQIREKANRILDVGDTKRALAFYDSAYQEIMFPGIGDEISRYNFLGDNYYRKTGDLHRAVETLDSVFLLLSTKKLKSEYINEYATTLFCKGDLLFGLQKYNEAYQCYYQGKVTAETFLNRCALAEYTYRLGMVSYRQAKYAEAALHFKQCFQDMNLCPDDFRGFAMKQELLGNISLSYSKLDLIDSALVYSKQTLDFIAENGKKFPDRKDYIDMAKGVIYGNQADLYYKTGDIAFAEKLLLKSIEINSKKGFDNRDAQLSKLKLGELYITTNQLEKAQGIASQLELSLDSVKNPEAEIRLSKFNWDYYDKRQQKAEAYIHLLKYMSLKDSLDDVNKRMVTADLDKEFQRLEQKNKYISLSRENELKKIWLYAAILFSMLVVVILFLLWRNWRASKNNIATLTRLNKQVSFQNGQLEHTLEDLKLSSDDKDRILKVVAHDLRNPIGAIANIADIILEEAKLNLEHHKMLELVKESSWQSIDMINDLLTANLTNRPSEMKKTWVNMSDLVDQCVEQLRFKAEEKMQNIIVDSSERIEVMADHEKISRVVSNLIVNAIKFSLPETEISVSLRHNKEGVELLVADHGIGIPVVLQDKVYDMFGESKRTGTAGEQAFGIGLPFSKQIVEAHGGRIWFQSEVDKGTTFHVLLPIEQKVSDKITKPSIAL